MLDARLKGVARPAPRMTDLVTLAAPTQATSTRDGSMGSTHGLFHGDWRYLRSLDALVNGSPISIISTHEEPGRLSFRAVSQDASGAALPHVDIERMRELGPGSLVERVTLINERAVEIDAVLALSCEIEFAANSGVQVGAPAAVPVTIERDGDEIVVTDGIRSLRVRGIGSEVRIDGNRLYSVRRARVQPGDWASISLEFCIDDPTLAVSAAEGEPVFTELAPTGRDALDLWTQRALDDLEGLLLDAGHGPFLAAGAPWHLTMVANEALTASRLLLPVDATLAASTLRTIAARQGVRFDAATGEEPGRMLHEMRQGQVNPERPDVEVSPSFRGSIEATPLWIVLLHDAWQAGMPLDAVRELRTALYAALGWMHERTGEGFLASHDEHEHDVPGAGVVTARVQGLVCRAAVSGAALLDALGDDGAPWQSWAERLRHRFRANFWIGKGTYRYPAKALDASGFPVEVLSSGIGQLIGTTLLNPAEEARVARLLLDPCLASGWGLRTVATDAEGYWPLSDNSGVVQPHDTAVVIESLLRSGFVDEAIVLAEQLERAAEAFDSRMPELFCGYGANEVPAPVHFPGAGSPRAWSAASVVPVRAALALASVEHDLRRPTKLRLVPPATVFRSTDGAGDDGTDSTVQASGMAERSGASARTQLRLVR